MRLVVAEPVFSIADPRFTAPPVLQAVGGNAGAGHSPNTVQRTWAPTGPPDGATALDFAHGLGAALHANGWVLRSVDCTSVVAGYAKQFSTETTGTFLAQASLYVATDQVELLASLPLAGDAIASSGPVGADVPGDIAQCPPPHT